MRKLAVSVVVIGLTACGPSVSSRVDGGDGDGASSVDSGPHADALPYPVLMYVQTADTLYTIDDVSFELTEIGTFQNGGDDITDIAVTPNGTLYGISNTTLYTIDKDTGEAAWQAELGESATNVGLTFLPDGTLLATDQDGGVRQIDPINGNVTERGSFGGGYATAGDLVAVADGTMYAISDEGPYGNEQDDNLLLTINTDTGAYIEEIGPIGYGGVFGCAYDNGHVYAFTRDGLVIEIDRNTGAGTLKRTYDGTAFWGAGVTPLVVVD